MHVDTSNFKVSLQSPSAVINAVALQSQDHSGKVLTPEGPHLCVGYVIETVHYLCLLAMYDGNVAAMVVGCPMMPRPYHRIWTRVRSSSSRRLTERRPAAINPHVQSGGSPLASNGVMIAD